MTTAGDGAGGAGVGGAAVVVEAYVLVQTEVGRADQVAAALADLDGVIAADAVTGPYDVVVHVGARPVDDLGALVLGQIAVVPGIVRTVTCTVMRE